MTTHSWYAPTVEFICIITRSLFMYMTYKKKLHTVSENINGLIQLHTLPLLMNKGPIQCLAQKACKNNGHFKILVKQMMNWNDECLSVQSNGC